MSTSGWVFMLLAWSSVIGLFVYCFYRILLGGGNQLSE